MLHTIILICAHGVEDQIDHAVGGAAHALERLGDGDAVVLDVGEVGMREGCDGYGGCGGVLGGVGRGGVGDVGGGLGAVALGGGVGGGLEEGVGVVLAQGVDEGGYWGDLGAEEGEF